MAISLSISIGSAGHITHDLGYSNIHICAQDTFPRSFMDVHKTIFL